LIEPFVYSEQQRKNIRIADFEIGLMQNYW